MASEFRRDRFEGRYIVQPSLDETLRSGTSCDNSVPEHLVREQPEEILKWPDKYRIDTTGLTVKKSFQLVVSALT